VPERVEVKPPEGGGAQRLSNAINRLAMGIARHWLAIFNIVVAVFVLLPFLAPVLMHAGATSAGTLIYKVYAPTCHQLPERSIFLFGPEPFYTVPELEADHYVPAGINIFQREQLRWAGSGAAGWKVAICERDIAIYGSMLIAGLVFALLRPRLRRGGKWPKMPVWMYLLFLLPTAIDGFTQLFGLRESTPGLRFITGALMGAATVWFAYPYVEEAMADVLKQGPAPAAPPGSPKPPVQQQETRA
jgi:uncharacterized membrane protein